MAPGGSPCTEHVACREEPMRSVGSWGLMTAMSGVREEGLSGLRWNHSEPPTPATTILGPPGPMAVLCGSLFLLSPSHFTDKETEVQLGHMTSPRLVAEARFSPRAV